MIYKLKLSIIVGMVILGGSASVAFASTNISAAANNHWAWNSIIGWIDFYTSGNIVTSASGTTGWATSSAGVIALDCATSPSGNCSIPYTVANDGAGDLSGWAWNDAVGWISFWCGQAFGGSCATSPYRVTINPGGDFQGWAWNDAVGWIDFNCGNPEDSICATSNFKVSTSWAPTSTTGTLDSTTFDTGVPAGVQLNSVVWQGPPVPAQTSVAFQFAVSVSSTGPWNFTGPGGTTSTADVWAGGNPGVPISLSTYAQYANFRYFRYRIILTSDPAQSVTPRVDDVIMHWSP